jgi:hypothetical protein
MSVIMQNVIMLNVVILSIVAPFKLGAPCPLTNMSGSAINGYERSSLVCQSTCSEKWFITLNKQYAEDSEAGTNSFGFNNHFKNQLYKTLIFFTRLG